MLMLTGGVVFGTVWTVLGVYWAVRVSGARHGQGHHTGPHCYHVAHGGVTGAGLAVQYVCMRMAVLTRLYLTGRGRHHVGRVCSVPVILCWIDAAGHGAATSWYDSMLCVIAWSIDMCCGGGMQAFLLTLSPSQSSPRSPLLRRSLSAWVRSRLALSVGKFALPF